MGINIVRHYFLLHRKLCLGEGVVHATSLLLLFSDMEILIMPWYCGIDLSMTSPAMCCHHTDDAKLSWYYMNTTKSKLKSSHNLHSALIDIPKSVNQDLLEGSIDASFDRYNQISGWFMKIIDLLQPKHIFLEGYSLGSTGKVFSIAENTAVLKQKLYDKNYYVSVIPPTVVKKFATGKGNASKQKMREEFFKINDIANKRKLIEPRITDLNKVAKYVNSPMTDLIDAYYICMYGIHLLQHRGFADDVPAAKYHVRIDNLDLGP